MCPVPSLHPLTLPQMSSPIDLTTFSTYSESDFVAALGGCYENTPSVAALTYNSLLATGGPPFDSITALHGAMKSVVHGFSREEKLQLINNHPDLAGKAAVAGALTAESTAEQAKAGLGSLSAEEMADFTSMNAAYMERFGFVFILAVRNATKRTILTAFAARLKNSAEREFEECMNQIHKIAWMRLQQIVKNKESGFLTVHVLDTAGGKPADGLRVTLTRLEGEGVLGQIGEFVTNDDGRLATGPALKGKDFTVGVYEWVFGAGDYFIKEGYKVDGQLFLDEVPIRFGIDNPEDHYHVPLLCSPYSFSTYRGS